MESRYDGHRYRRALPYPFTKLLKPENGAATRLVARSKSSVTWGAKRAAVPCGASMKPHDYGLAHRERHEFPPTGSGGSSELERASRLYADSWERWRDQVMQIGDLANNRETQSNGT
jgi:hypothetical protein